MDFELKATAPGSQARAGLITTDHGTIETPIFMPVGTLGAVKAVHMTELRDDINESCLAICKHYAIPCIQLHDIHKINGHPSKMGMKAIAQEVLDVIK